MRKKAIWWQLAVLAVSLLVLCAYRLWDSGRTDSTAPKIEIDTAELILSVQDSKSALLQGVSAYDAVDGDVTDSLVIESVYGVTEGNRVTVTYAAFDKSGNVSKAERSVLYADYRSPRFTLSESLTYQFGSGFDVMAAVGAEDVFDGDIQRLVKATMLTSGTSVATEGIHDVQFRVTNSLGDTVQLTLPVEVYPANSYNAELSLREYLIYLTQGDGFEPEAYLSNFRVLTETIDLRGGIPDAVKIQINGKADTQTPGVYPISYLATYTLDGQTHSGYAKLFVVVEG